MNGIKRMLFRLFGVKRYLLLVSRVFFMLYGLRFLKGNQLYDCHYFVKKLIGKGNVVIDVGANLGYYSVIFSKLVGFSGKVYSVEPVALFREVFQQNTTKYSNIELLPYALGAEDNQNIKMGVPSKSEYFSHGRTHVLKNDENCRMVFDAVVMRPETLFLNLTSLDYIKCDIEGYEGIAIPLFEKIIDRFHPILQIEIERENFEKLYRFFKEKGYLVFCLKGERLIEVVDQNDEYFGDVFFMPPARIEHLQKYMS